MSSIPLPALDLRPPATPASPLAEFAQVSALKSQMQNQQLQQQEIQLRQQQVKNQQATTSAMQNWDPKSQSYDDLAKSVLNNGGDATAAMAVTQHGIQVQQGVAALNKEQLGNYQATHKAMGDRLLPLTDPQQVPDEQLHGKALDTVMDFVNRGWMGRNEGQQAIQDVQTTQDPNALRAKITQMAKVAQGAEATAAQQKEAAGTAAEQGKARESNAQAAHQEIINNLTANAKPGMFNAQIDSMLPPNSPATAGQNRMVKMQIDSALQRGDYDGAKQYADQAFQNVEGVQKDVAEATNPAIQASKVALAQRIKQAEQVITQGDPAAAGKLLADGSLTLSELKSRGTTPQFIVQATNAAKQAKPGYNPQTAEAELNVAKSPANLAFFGSAKSLTDPGGTLDQLKAAGNNIPQHDFPVFNSFADIYKAQTGSGPIAKYAATLVGVADDYAKVTGGGAGTEGMQKFIMSLAAAKASPEQREGTLEGFRGAVNSQIKSRIGSNAVMQNMYGGSNTAPPPAATGKVLSNAAIQQAAKDHGVSVDEATRQAKAAGYTIQ